MTNGVILWKNIFKLEDTFRILLGKLNGIPIANNHQKNGLLNFLLIWIFDISGLPEASICWSKVIACDQLYGLIIGWCKRLHITKGYNIHKVPDYTFKWVGVLKIDNNMNASQAFGSVLDFSGFGWWIWNQFWGKTGIIMGICTFYQPLDNARGFWSTLDQQHK